MPQNFVSNPDVTLMRLGANFRLKVRAHNVFHDVHNTDCSELFVVILFQHDGKVYDCRYEIHKREVMTHNSGHLICKRDQLDSFRLADCHHDFSSKETNQDGLLNPTYVAFHTQPSHWIQTMISVWEYDLYAVTRSLMSNCHAAVQRRINIISADHIVEGH